MKKFKTRNNNSKIKILLIILSFFIIFILISLYNLKGNHHSFITYLLNDFSNESPYNLRFLTSNLDDLFNSYSFENKSILYKNDNST